MVGETLVVAQPPSTPCATDSLKNQLNNNTLSCLPQISWQQLASHCSRSDCWLAVRGVVYDVTPWVAQHPGGADVLVLNAGKDATSLFECYHPFGAAHQVLRKFAVATLIDTELPTFPPMSTFYLTLKRRVYEHIAARRTTIKSAPWTIAVGLAYFVGVFVAYFASVSLLEQHLMGLGVLAAIFAGWCSAMVCLVPTHEGSHLALTHHPIGWRLLGATLDLANGCSFFSWLHQHLLGHHPYTNLGDVDPDVHTNEPDVRRIKRSQAESTRYRLQHLYVPLLYGLLALKFRINDLQMYFSLRSNGRIRMNDAEPFHAALFYIGKLWVVLYRVVLPLCIWGLSSFSSMCIAAVITDLVASYYLSICFQVNHVVPEAQWPSVTAAPSLPSDPLPTNADLSPSAVLASVQTKSAFVNVDWAVMQVTTTIDYAHDSWLTTKLTGALNYQVVHHLFPEISQAHYMDIAPIVRKTCAEFQVPYVVLPTFWDAFKAHLKHLRQLGASDLLHSH
jgi:cytochrome b involved in lipid metabolism